MPRTIDITLSPNKTDILLNRVGSIDGVTGVALQRGASLNPSGDIVTVTATNDGTRAVLGLLGELDVLNGGSVRTSASLSLISPSYQNGIDRESNETIWEEMAFLLRRDTNLSINFLLLMALAGAVAAVGLWTNTLHIVVGSMVIAPGFEPLLRMPFGFIGGPRALASRGLYSTVAGYGSLALGAALMLLALRLMDPNGALDLETRSWVRYWSTVTPSGVLLALVAGVAGAVTVTSQRSVLSTGVMIALALIPAMSITGMALVVGDLTLAGQGLMRWAVEAISVIIAGTIVLGLKQMLLHRRHAQG